MVAQEVSADAVESRVRHEEGEKLNAQALVETEDESDGNAQRAVGHEHDAPDSHEGEVEYNSPGTARPEPVFCCCDHGKGLLSKDVALGVWWGRGSADPRHAVCMYV